MKRQLERGGIFVPAVLMMSVLTVVGGATPSWACVCAAPSSDQAAFEGADVVFIGTADHAVPIHGSDIQADPWTFTVESIQKGSRRTSFEISAGHQLTVLHDGGIGVATSSCSARFTLGRRYQVFAANRGDGLHASTCSATRELAAPGKQPDPGRAQMEPYTLGTSSLGGFTAAAVAALALGLAFTLRRRQALL